MSTLGDFVTDEYYSLSLLLLLAFAAGGVYNGVLLHVHDEVQERINKRMQLDTNIFRWFAAMPSIERGDWEEG